MNAEGAPADGAETARNGTQRHATARNGTLFLSERELAALSYIEANPGSSRSDLSSRLGMSKRGTLRLLQRLMDLGLVERTGSSRSTSYRAVGRRGA